MQPVYQITLRSTGASFPCKQDQMVFDAMLKARSGPKFHGCCGGGCGVCKMRILLGGYEAVKRMSRAHISAQEEENGTVLLCCVQPRSHLVIDTV